MNASVSGPFWRRLRTPALGLIFLLALCIRVYDLTDLPLDFHPTRQLVSALKARGMYYQGRTDVPEWQVKFAVQQWKTKAQIEPEVVERLVAFTYRFSGEQLWVGRLYSIIFWLVGGIFLYLLGREFTSAAGALFALLFYLFLPYGVIASRSFQPDPLMLMFILAFWWAIARWVRSLDSAGGSLPWALAAGLLGGLAIFIKFSAAFFILGAALGMTLGREPLARLLRRPQLWLMAAVGILPGLVYLIYGIFLAGFLEQQFSGRFIASLLVSPAFYLNWLSTLNHVLGFAGLALSLLGSFFFRGRPARTFVFALWGAYLLYGFYFDYHIWSHDYYNLPLIPIAALSLSPLAAWVAAGLEQATAGSPRLSFAALAVVVLGLGSAMWESRAALKAVDYRPEADFWTGIARELGTGSRVVALTPDYGSRLVYWGWLDPAPWPLAGDLAYHVGLRGASQDFDAQFSRLALKRDFFLVTLPDELALQPFLQERLVAFPIFKQGDGYVIYDLR